MLADKQHKPTLIEMLADKQHKPTLIEAKVALFRLIRYDYECLMLDKREMSAPFMG